MTGIPLRVGDDGGGEEMGKLKHALPKHALPRPLQELDGDPAADYGCRLDRAMSILGSSRRSTWGAWWPIRTGIQSAEHSGRRRPIARGPSTSSRPNRRPARVRISRIADEFRCI